VLYASRVLVRLRNCNCTETGDCGDRTGFTCFNPPFNPAEVSREAHEAELETIARVFGDVKSADEVIKTLVSSRRLAVAD